MSLKFGKYSILNYHITVIGTTDFDHIGVGFEVENFTG